ncbi:hypothetical protein BpHYR1_004022 [Brachionus plicatilis]|uniref:Uncharacterized protein n=1 Tax=Brachionus plicatilis TaxID=10195 RepID=A0A3M7T1E1_BRAPC|nr:hypothetical protein BpHYR1_004022 [Brachionus plicatilis]
MHQQINFVNKFNRLSVPTVFEYHVYRKKSETCIKTYTLGSYIKQIFRFFKKFKVRLNMA